MNILRIDAANLSVDGQVLVTFDIASSTIDDSDSVVTVIVVSASSISEVLNISSR